MLGHNFVNILSDEESDRYFHGHLTKDFLAEEISDLNRYIYLCGPPE